MSWIHLHSEPPKSGTTPRVSVRTLVLMLELLVAVITWQHFAMAEPFQARAIWLAGDCHTASTMCERAADPVATPPAPAPAEEGESEP
jgi:hypothetical protein